MDRNKKVSVYCTAYNHEKYIEDTLKGFVRQKTNFEFEVIVHDDASTDGTRDIIQKYVKLYPQLIKPIFQTENQYSKGIGILVEYLLPCLQGEYVALCEGDDFWIDPYKLQKQVDFLDSHQEYGGCVHNSVLYDNRKHTNRLFNSMPKGIRSYDCELSQSIKNWGEEFHTSSVMYRKWIADKFYIEEKPEFGQKIKEVGDFPLAIYLLLNGKVRYMPDVMSVYRLGTEGSWTEKQQNKKVRIQSDENIISMLESVNKYTEYRYQSIFDPEICARKFELLAEKGEYRKMFATEFKDILNEKTVEYRFKLKLRSCFPFVVDWLKGER